MTTANTLNEMFTGNVSELITDAKEAKQGQQVSKLLMDISKTWAQIEKIINKNPGILKEAPFMTKELIDGNALTDIGIYTDKVNKLSKAWANNFTVR